jgi:hypothetical protein
MQISGDGCKITGTAEVFSQNFFFCFATGCLQKNRIAARQLSHSESWRTTEFQLVNSLLSEMQIALMQII